MLAPFEKSAFKEAGNVCDGHRPVRDSTFRTYHLDQRLQPIHAARPIPDYLKVVTARCGFGTNGRSDALRSHGKGDRIPGDEDCCLHCLRASSIISEKRSGLTRPWTSPSSIRVGEQA